MHLRFTCLKHRLKDFGAAVKLLREQLDKWHVVSNMQLSVKCSNSFFNYLHLFFQFLCLARPHLINATIVCRNFNDNHHIRDCTAEC